MHYDYLIVGAGLFGSVMAYELTEKGKSCLVLEKRSHIGGNCFSREIEGIQVHQYGPHIFHTADKEIWNYTTGLVPFNHFKLMPIANYRGTLFNLPFNMNTFCKMWPDVITPFQAMEKIEQQKKAVGISVPENLEQQAISLVGVDVYEKLVKGYTEKQWGRPCKELPPFIIRRLPVRFTFDNNYFNDPYQGIPIGGYTKIFEKLLANCEVKLKTDYLEQKEFWDEKANQIVYTGPLDAYFQYRFGPLQYRALRFETEVLDEANHQGVAMMNYTSTDVPYTRIVEHKHFEFGTQPKTVITREFSSEWHPGEEPYYPINDQENQALYEKYSALAQQEKRVHFGGRLAEYKYYDMDKTIMSALKMVGEINP